MIGPLLVLSTLAHAGDLDPMDPSGSLSTGTGTPLAEAATFTDTGLSLGLMAAVASDTFVLRYPSSGRKESVFQTAVPLTLHGGWTFGDRARVDVHVPFYPLVRADYVDHNGPAMGDVRVAGVVRLWSPHALFNLSVAPTVGLPTGSRNLLVGRGAYGRLHLVLGGEDTIGFGWTANLGATVSGTDVYEDVAVGSTIDAVAGLWWRFDTSLRVGADLSSTFGLASADTLANTNVTGHVFGQISLPEGLSLTAGVGASPYASLGAPVWRVLGQLSWQPGPRDRDKDLLPDRQDPCPDRPEDLDGFEDEDGCPDLDNDADGVLDTADACPDHAEDPDGFEDEDGCPDLDNDADGLLDADDACPDQAGTEATAGCPDADGDGLRDAEDACPDTAGLAEFEGCADTDGDLVPDPRDACPDQPRPASEDPAVSDGCPKRVIVTAEAIELQERVFFDTGSARIQEKSFPLLDDVATVLRDHAQILKVQVTGHTDNTGSTALNVRLSRDRARAVVTYLIGKGIDGKRLAYDGQGPNQPIASNDTEEGRAANRRVEMTIVDQAPVTTEVEVE